MYGLIHNEQGVFIHWSFICSEGQQLLLVSSSSLVTNNTLTDEGDKAVGCVRNGLMLPAANQQYLHLSFGMEKMIIGSLTGMTGCNNFINMNAL